MSTSNGIFDLENSDSNLDIENISVAHNCKSNEINENSKMNEKRMLNTLVELPCKRACTLKKWKHANSPLMQNYTSRYSSQNQKFLTSFSKVTTQSTNKITIPKFGPKKVIHESSLIPLKEKEKKRNKKKLSNTGRRVKI